MVWLIAVSAAAAVAGIASTLREIDLIERVIAGGEFTMAEARASDDRQQAIGAIQLALVVATGVAWLVWQHRAHANLRDGGAGGLKFTPGWAVGWWFVPIANLWQPFRAMSELARRGPPAPDRSLPPGVGAWWAAFVGSGIVGRLSAGLARSEEAEDILLSSRLSIAGDALLIVAAVLAVGVVRAVDRAAALPQERAA